MMKKEDIDPATLERLRAATGGEPGEREVVLAQLERMDIAAAEPDVCGQLRRAVAKADTHMHTLAVEIGIPPMLLQDFLEGLADLDSATIDRLAERLGLTLVYSRDPLAVERLR
jgi:hypothetical protein